MPILDIPHGLRRVGKLRMGEQVEASNGQTRPAKLETWRVTSPDAVVLKAVADAYGGTVEPWDNNGAAEFQVVTDAASLDVLITPEEDSFSQWYELWSNGGCQRRCDSETETLTAEPCKCPADKDERAELAAKGKACKATTRVSVILPRVPALGAWMVESHGYYAARELGSTFHLLDLSGARQGLLPARLRIEQRMVKRDGKTNKFGVPVFDFDMRFDQLVALPPAGVNPATGELAASDQPALPAAEPVTSTKKAAARKEAAKRTPAPAQPDEPMTQAEVDAVRARVAVLDGQHRYLVAHAMNNARVTLKGGPPPKSEAKKIETILVEIEEAQAAAWEARRVAVAVALDPYKFDVDARHQFIADATEGATESMKTLTQEQANQIIEAAAGPPEQQTIADAS